MSDRPTIDVHAEIARERLGWPNAVVVAWSSMSERNFDGTECVVWEQLPPLGARTGRPNWWHPSVKTINKQTIIVTGAEYRAWIAAWEARTGNCFRCIGTGERRGDHHGGEQRAQQHDDGESGAHVGGDVVVLVEHARKRWPASTDQPAHSSLRACHLRRIVGALMSGRLVEALRRLSCVQDLPECMQAADEIERLNALVNDLRLALVVAHTQLERSMPRAAETDHHVAAINVTRNAIKACAS